MSLMRKIVKIKKRDSTSAFVTYAFLINISRRARVRCFYIIDENKKTSEG